MKRGKLQVVTTLAVIAMVAMGMIGCSNSDKESSKTGTLNQVADSTAATMEDTTETEQEETEKNPEAETETPEVPIIEIPMVELEEKTFETNEALDFVANMKLGWNLGNTFDAVSNNEYVQDSLSLESDWVGVTTTKEMIAAVKEAGFETIRIPVSWHNHVDENFQINEAWLNRVQEVVDYAIDSDMYVILNIHHDIDPLYYFPDSEHFDNSKKYIEAIWTQVGERFLEYSDKLIFESINEPRLKGTDSEWWLDMNKDSSKDAVDCINRLNQVFVDLIRSQGGNNSTRYLMVPGYAASANFALIHEFVLPVDSSSNQNKIIVSVHAYTPYNFALQGPNESGNVDDFNIKNKSRTDEINNFIDQLYGKFISKGIPVVIGEFGARDKNGNLEDRVHYAAYYIAAARNAGITCVWWDNHAFSGTGENFGLLNRRTLSFIYPEIVEAMNQYSVK